jgi:hypothetical protein
MFTDISKEHAASIFRPEERLNVQKYDLDIRRGTRAPVSKDLPNYYYYYTATFIRVVRQRG